MSRDRMIDVFVGVARGRSVGGGDVVPRGGGDGQTGASGLHRHVQGVPHFDARPQRPLLQRTGASQLRHADVIPGAHRYLQDAARQEKRVSTSLSFCNFMKLRYLSYGLFFTRRIT